MKEINDELMDKLLYLARLELAPEAYLEMEKELNKMTEWLHKLTEVDTEGVMPLTNITTEINRLREDVPQAPLTSEQVLCNAPDRSSHYFRTPSAKKD